MGKIVFGIDPDSEKFGFARYSDCRLSYIDSLPLIDVIGKVLDARDMAESVEVAIEDVMSNQFVYGRNSNANKSVESKIAMRVGRCQQAQVELERMLDHYGIKYFKYPPCRRNFAKNADQFKRLTGWQGKSNEDQRAAAYFGLLHIQQPKTKFNS